MCTICIVEPATAAGAPQKRHEPGEREARPEERNDDEERGEVVHLEQGSEDEGGDDRECERFAISTARPRSSASRVR
jgi:hypothetical protein